MAPRLTKETIRLTLNVTQALGQLLKFPREFWQGAGEEPPVKNRAEQLKETESCDV